MYRRVQIAEGNPPKDLMSLLDYKMHLGMALINYSLKEPYDCNRLSESEEENEQPNKRRKVVEHPVIEKRLDGVDHLPEFVNYASIASPAAAQFV